MKNIIMILGTMILVSGIFAQTPEKLSYQSVIRNSDGTLVETSIVGVQISILQTTVSGLLVFQETHTVTTNENGLATLEIGGGTPVTGTFSAIDWSAGPYFLKTETDPAGGTSYTIAGTSELLGVPYALYAKTAGSTNGTSGRFTGELYGGGAVFYVDPSGEHGLICSMIDLSTVQVWSDVMLEIGSTAQSSWDGQSNTTAIVNQPGMTTSAAKLCDDYSNDDYGTGIFSDWYLPAGQELFLLNEAGYNINMAIMNDGNPVTTPLQAYYYWSSTEANSTQGWNNFLVLGSPSVIAKTAPVYVRAIRSF
ncbi:MAG: DUF1566 domain-containing protein [Bacteroidales bacterium]|nr:DUF1566 domain-containing protein [Bacteroidales bacterium]